MKREEAGITRDSGFAPAITLMVMAPLLAEVLPGATRFSSFFVFPVEMCVWGGGAVLIRYAVRRHDLGWINMMLLALALSFAEEFIIQQTSIAPMVLKLKGEVYARAFGVNYVYLLWALVYEAVFVVFLPVYLVELIFPGRRDHLWINRTGLFTMMFLFVTGGGLAWFTWTQIARPDVFHVPLYNPPLEKVIFAVLIISLLIYLALGPLREKLNRRYSPLKPPKPWLAGICGGLWAMLWYGLVLLGFGILPTFPPLLAIFAGLMLILPVLILLPRWSTHPDWQNLHYFGLISGTITGSMLAGFIGFIGTRGIDLYFKCGINIIALGLLIYAGSRLTGKHSDTDTRKQQS